MALAISMNFVAEHGKENIMVKEKLIVALDFATETEAIKMVDQLDDAVSYYKVGMQLYNSVGPTIIQELTTRDKKVFLDLKLHDIPNTVAQAGAVLTNLGVSMFNVHVSGGTVMMRETVKKVTEEAERQGIDKPKVIGVTILTSMNQQQFEEDLGYSVTIEEKVAQWSVQAKAAGLDGVVASAEELPIIRKHCGHEFLVVTPGIRPIWAVANDQQRIVTPKDAMDRGASHIVVGRPICASQNPKEAALKILAEMESGS